MNSGSRLTITAIKRKYAGGEKERGGYSRSIKIWLRSETRTMNEEKRKIERAMNIVLIKVRIKQSTQNTPNITAHTHTHTHNSLFLLLTVHNSYYHIEEFFIWYTGCWMKMLLQEKREKREDISEPER